jgi:hypothetical protein
MLAGIEREIDRAGCFGQRLEDLVYNAAKDGKVVYRLRTTISSSLTGLWCSTTAKE